MRGGAVEGLYGGGGGGGVGGGGVLRRKHKVCVEGIAGVEVLQEKKRV